MIVEGDGAAWVKEGARYINGRFQLDRYHLNRDLLTALGRDGETRRKIRHACDNGNAGLGLQIIAGSLKKARGEQDMRIAKAYHYLENNVSGLGNYRLASGAEAKELRRTGAIEGNVDKLVVRRMKNQGMSCTIKGIRRLLCLRFLVLEGRLKDWLTQENEPGIKIHIPHKKLCQIVNNIPYQETAAWLEELLPALYSPYFSKPWVKSHKARSEMILLYK